MSTTIQISDNVRETLERMKLFERETFNEIIENMIEDNLELNEKTKQELIEARKRIKQGRFITQEEIERRFEL